MIRHSSFFLFEITFSIFGDDRHSLLEMKLLKKSVLARLGPWLRVKHCLYRGGAGNKFKVKTWRTFLRITIDRLADVMEGGY